MRKIEREEERIKFTDPDKPSYHLCIVNLGEMVDDDMVDYEIINWLIISSHFLSSIFQSLELSIAQKEILK